MRLSHYVSSEDTLQIGILHYNGIRTKYPLTICNSDKMSPKKNMSQILIIFKVIKIIKYEYYDVQLHAYSVVWDKFVSKTYYKLSYILSMWYFVQQKMWRHYVRVTCCPTFTTTVVYCNRTSTAHRCLHSLTENEDSKYM